MFSPHLENPQCETAVARALVLFLALWFTALPLYAGKLACEISLGKAQGEAVMAMRKESLDVKIKSPVGIGTAKLSLRKGAEWPKQIVLLIRRNDAKPLAELEGFTLQGKRIRISGSRQTSGKMESVVLSAGEQDPAEKPASRKVDITVVKTEAAMKIVIPGTLLAGESEVQIQWIDFYRG